MFEIRRVAIVDLDLDLDPNLASLFVFLERARGHIRFVLIDEEWRIRVDSKSPSNFAEKRDYGRQLLRFPPRRFVERIFLEGLVIDTID